MPRIHVLPDILASQVAAGEVVERPASVVKELMENSLDAGAAEILIEIERGGTALIRITDDGCGMDRDDALLSLERHATSKLRSSSDLHQIQTLGFRGEAMPSIASVSRFRLITRERSAIHGTEVQVHGGKIIDVRDAGCAPGTSIEVKQLFYNIPARRKFLKTETTESAHVEHEVRIHALATPPVRFRFRRDGHEVFELPAVERKSDRLRHLLGVESAEELIEVPLHHGHGFAVEGFLLPAHHARKGRKHQCVFLNGRPIEDSAVSRGLVDGFKGGLMEGMHPAAWLWIEMEPSLVDVNVHPAKREVRFHRPHELREGISTAVTQGLQKHERRSSTRPAAEVPTREGLLRSYASPPSSMPAPTSREQQSVVASPSEPSISPPSLLLTPRTSWLTGEQQQEITWSEPPSTMESTIAPPLTGAAAFRWLGLIRQRFAALESADGLVLFDPRAARERIVYEQLLAGEHKGVASQGLLVPLLIELDPRDRDVVMRAHDALLQAGIELGDFGGGTMQVRSLPAFLHLQDPRSFVHEIMDRITTAATNQNFAYDKLARLMAKQAGEQEVIEPSQAQRTLEELFTCDLPYCAADGRPTISEFSLREIEKRFGYR
jgi:DNA mismatch repair protein MutL